jgi:hypothetical protein
MRTRDWLVIGILLAGPLALAQAPNPYNGTWHVSLKDEGGKSREGTVTFKDEAGTWKITAKKFKNPCIGLQSPIVVQRATADELVFQINRSKALRGCEDNIANVKPVNETTLQGEVDDGRKITLTKE